MSTNTAKMQLVKPAGTENVDISILNANSDLVDLLLPSKVVTASTRPAGYDGQLIKETDTKKLLMYDAASSSWRPFGFADVLQGYKNAIRNGNFTVWQRGTGPFTATGVYTADGWKQNFVGAGTPISLSRAALAISDLPNSKYGLQAIVASQAAITDNVILTQSIEGVETYAGQQVTLSFWAKAAAGTPKVAVEVSQVFGAGGSPSATVNTAIGFVTLSTTLAKYSLTFTVPSIAGKTLGTDGTDKLDINLWLSAGTNFNARASSIGVQNGTFTFAQVQFELGSVASAFEVLPVGLEMSRSQRYFQRIGGIANVGWGVGLCVTTTTASFIIHLKSTMRATPTTVINNSAGTGVQIAAGTQTATSLAYSAANSSPDVIYVTATTAAVLVAGQSAILFNGAGAANLIDVSAEL